MARDAKARGEGPRAPGLVRALVGVLVVLAVWQGTAYLGFVSQNYYPPASTVLAYAAGLVVSPSFLGQVGVTLLSMLAGLAIAAAIAIPVGLVLGAWPRAYRIATLLVETMRPIPALALAPLAILLFGLSDDATVALVAWTAAWPILINSVYGMHQVDPVAIETAKSLRLSPAAILWRVALPSALPFIATGIWVSLGIALAVSVAAEMIAGSGGGLGGWIVEASSGGSLLPVYAAALLVGVLGFALNRLAEGSEARLFPWHGRRQRRVA
jgi:NitT/TauT family transport system permease protein